MLVRVVLFFGGAVGCFKPSAPSVALWIYILHWSVFSLRSCWNCRQNGIKENRWGKPAPQTLLVPLHYPNSLSPFLLSCQKKKLMIIREKIPFANKSKCILAAAKGNRSNYTGSSALVRALTLKRVSVCVGQFCNASGTLPPQRARGYQRKAPIMQPSGPLA